MTAGVVDHFEPVKIAQQHRHRIQVTGRIGQGAQMRIHSLVEGQPVGQAGERVGPGEQLLGGEVLFHRQTSPTLATDRHSDRRQDRGEQPAEQHDNRRNARLRAVEPVGADDHGQILVEQAKCC